MTLLKIMSNETKGRSNVKLIARPFWMLFLPRISSKYVVAPSGERSKTKLYTTLYSSERKNRFLRSISNSPFGLINGHCCLCPGAQIKATFSLSWRPFINLAVRIVIHLSQILMIFSGWTPQREAYRLKSLSTHHLIPWTIDLKSWSHSTPKHQSVRLYTS